VNNYEVNLFFQQFDRIRVLYYGGTLRDLFQEIQIPRFILEIFHNCPEFSITHWKHLAIVIQCQSSKWYIFSRLSYM